MFALICAWTNGWVNNQLETPGRFLWHHCNVTDFSPSSEQPGQHIINKPICYNNCYTKHGDIIINLTRKSMGAYNWYVKYHNAGISLEHIAFYVQKHMTPRAVCYNFLLVHNKPIGAPISVRWVYWRPSCIPYQHDQLTILQPGSWDCVAV